MRRSPTPRAGLRGPGLLIGMATAAAVIWLLGTGRVSPRDGDVEPTIAEAAPATPPTTTPARPTTTPGPPEWPEPLPAVIADAPDPIPSMPLAPRNPVNWVERVTAAPDGTLWAATAGGVVGWDPSSRTPAVLGTGGGLPEEAVLGVAAGADGTVWAGGEGWIARWDGSWTTFWGQSEMPLAVDADGAVWWGTREGRRIGRFDGIRWQIYGGAVPLGSESIALAPDGTVWTATASTDDTHDGVAAFDGEGWTRYGVDDGLPGPIGGSVAVTPDGVLWVGSKGSRRDHQPGGGVARYDGSNWTVFTTGDGLVTDNAGVVAGPDGLVWAVAPEGLARFDGEEWAAYPDAIGFGFGGTVDGSGVLWAPAAEAGGGILGFDGDGVTRLLAPRAEAAVADGAESLTPQERAELPNDARLDFLATVCGPGACSRDAHFVDPLDDGLGYGRWAAGLPFHIRHGFVDESPEPLAAGHDLAVYVTRREGPDLESDAFPIDRTYRFSTDYVSRAATAKCGPGYWEQTEPQTCRWFVHDFGDGLPPGRYDIWAEWLAPCSTWEGLGLTPACGDPAAVMSLFASSVNMPFYGDGYPAGGPQPFDPYSQPEPITRGAGAG